MENISHIIGWMGVLFLSVEAIKLDNLKKLTVILQKIRIAINSPMFWDEESKRVFLHRPAEGYEVLRKYGNLITYLIGVFIIAVFFLTTHLLPDAVQLAAQYICVFKGVSVYRIILNVFILLILFAAIPYYLGNEFVRMFSIVADRYHRLMVIVERNTFNGIIGIIGFLLVSVSTIINIALH